MVYSLLQIILGRIGVDMGYIAFINGSGVTVEIDDSGVHLVKSVITCEMCGDDRVFKDGTCFRCHELIARD
jgi:hypothetical protein